MRAGDGHFWRQWAVLALGLTLWAAEPRPAWWALLLSYALALLIVIWLLAKGAAFALPRAARARSL